ncbi:proprotein convertase subtilisin/kexin type 5 isoform X1 [Acinonyx jubatus]|uniref:Proprotein convertase subtilisin/kexin type 5 n=3 Tax=Acinonyx jubatus TaxID=32536 RepID=A0A6J1XWZ9_ACIJB|nr:proprotein convertase subtilisin/kexin type 5 isoform X1 [Acinonyx jubatus]
MQSRRCCHCHSHSPRAARSRRERRERASERSEPGPAEGAPGRCLHRRLRRVPGPGEERRLVGESGAEPARPNCRRAPAPLSRLLRRSRGAPADRPAGRRARRAGPRSPRDGLGAGARLAVWSPPGLAASCGSPRAARRGGRGLRAGAAQAGEVSCARRSCAESASERGRQRGAGAMGWGSRCCCPGRLDLLCVLALLGGCLLPVCRTRVYTNHWAVKIAGGFPEANRIASKYGFINMGQIGALKDYYHFYHSRTIKRSVLSSRGTHSFISMEPKVEWIQQQVVKRRTKRDYDFSRAQPTYFNDPKWPSMWYMHCSDNTHPCQSDMNIEGAWKRGYTGKNIVVTILDDGIERTHPDLLQNYDALASCDVNGNDLDPMPRYDASNENKHGTRCAGEVAAAANNSHCTVGIAFNAKIGGVRMLDGDVTDMVEAKSVSFNPQHVHIYSASWGPDDDGKTVDGPAPLTRQAFENGVRMGRRGLGSVFVWASGNGGRSKDHCSCDGYTNSIYTISISSTAESGKKPWYLEECSSTLATTYSSGESYDKKIITTDLRQRCTDNHTGTSASAPMAAGIIALALEANPFLTWRDVQHVIVRTSRAGHLNANDWKTNAAGFKVSHLYGFGLMDAEAMVMEAEKWTTVPQQHVCVESTDRQIKTIRPNSAVRSIYKASGCSDNPNHHVNYLEHVVVRITITHPRRGDLAIYLTSPSGTRSQLLANRLFDHSMEGFKNWEFMTIHCWGERATGDWILEVYDTPSQLRNFKTPGKLKEWSLVLYGTSVQPYSPTNEFPKVERVRYTRVEDPTEDYGTEDYAGPCDPECSEVGCDGPGPDHCSDCLHYYYKLKNNTRICVSSCPPGHYHADKKRCRKCAPNCESCFGSHGDQCLSCKYGYFLNEEINSCVTHCPDGSYQDTKKSLCRKCSENCKTCTEFHNCTECRDGLSLQGSQCSITCEDGQYFNGQDCQPCHRFCATCAGAGATGCINCTEGYFMEDGRCVQACSTSYYLDHSSEHGYKSCKKCDASCLTCNGPGFKNCTSCPSGYLLDLGTCQMGAICKDGEYIDEHGHCQICDASCAKCWGPTQEDCTGCPVTRIFDNGHCVFKCPSGKFEFQNQCHLCHYTCQECQGNEPSNCTSCGVDKHGQERFLYQGGCWERCPVGYYPAEGHTCLPCPDNCELCHNARICVRCTGGYFLVPTNHTCQKSACGQGEVQDPDYGECVPCEEGCLGCNLGDPGACASCGMGYYMFQHHCHKTCPERTYGEGSECKPCDTNCSNCDQQECYSCEEGFFLLGGTCVRKCGPGFYGDPETGECEPCHWACETCTGFGHQQCRTCREGLQLRQGTCVGPAQTPVEGEFWNEPAPTANPSLVKTWPQKRRRKFPIKRDILRGHQPCHPSCETCNESATLCTSCPKGTYLLAQACVSSCPEGTWPSVTSGSCENCPEDCASCSGANLCGKCRTRPDFPLFLHEGRCYTRCPEGFYAEDSACRRCSAPCGTCEGNATSCRSCRGGFVLDQGACRETCPERHVAMDGVCKPCPKMCQDCIHEQTCKECMPESVLYKDMCHQSCPRGYYADRRQCVPCHEDCLECDGPSADDCVLCAESSSVLYDGRCLEECPAGTYYEKETKECRECHKSCRTCSSPGTCTTCWEGLGVASHGRCVPHKECAPVEYWDEALGCKPCHAKCFRCTGPAEDQCRTCPRDSLLLNTTCVQDCPEGYYADEDSHQCAPCHSSCRTCEGRRSTQCLSCQPSSFQLEKECLPQCREGYYAEEATGRCERCSKRCKACRGPRPTDCLSCDTFFFLLRSKGECHRTCPEHYYADQNTRTCERCHPTCSKCRGKGPLNCLSCVWSYHLAGGICTSDCLVGEYRVKEGEKFNCEKCHESCVECKGPGTKNCTVCPADLVLLMDDSRCLHCCNTSDPSDAQECCDCRDTTDECILQASEIGPAGERTKTALFITSSIMLVLLLGAAVIVWKKSRGRAQPVAKAGYEKLADPGKSYVSYKSSHLESTSFEEDQVIEYRDQDYDEEEDDDIVYMGQDGTIYRKFKYGLLDDDEDELEYDDESYSFQ